MTTATSRLQRITDDFKQRLLEHETTAAVELERAHSHALSVINPILDILYHSMEQKLRTGEEIPVQWLYENQRLQVLKAQIEGRINQFGALALTKTGELQHLAVDIGLNMAQLQLGATVPAGVSWSFGSPSPGAIASLLGATQKGSPLADLFSAFGQEAATAVSHTLVTGVTLGWNPREIAPSVLDALNRSRNRALVISRNELNRAYRSSNLLTYRENSDVVTMYRWTCARSSRTCIACLMMDGKLFNLDVEMQNHVCCRCSPTPVTRPWHEILGDLGIDTSDIPETSIAASGMHTGEAWFMQQSEATQKQIFGNNSMYKAWQDGEFDLSDVVGYNHSQDWGTSVRVKSVKELVKS